MNKKDEISVANMINTLSSNRKLIFSLIKREVLEKYQGSYLGLLWIFVNPILMLTVYTLVFSVVFQARWSDGNITESKVDFAIILFSGLIIFNFFSECINRSPLIIVYNVNYVKKIVFPLEILPVTILGSALFQFLVNIIVWFVFYLLFIGMPGWTALLLPLVILPLVFQILGSLWILASLGVYLRDIGQIISTLTTMLLFLSPIFFPVSMLPKDYQIFLNLNPLAPIIEEARNILIWGKMILWKEWGYRIILSAIYAWLGFVWFQKTRKGFADVL